MDIVLHTRSLQWYEAKCLRCCRTGVELCDSLRKSGCYRQLGNLAWTPGCQIHLKAAAVLIILCCMTHGNYFREVLLEISRQIHSIIIVVLFSPVQFNVPFPTYGSDCADWLHMTEPLAQVSSNFLVINEGPKHLISILFGWDACLN